MKKLKVVKIGGNIVDSPEALAEFLAQFAVLEGDKILVHGGGKIATKISAALGIETKMVDGRRITDADTIRVVTMVYAGGVNKSIVAQLNSLGCSAWGVCGADANIIPAIKRPVKSVDYGFVGDVLHEGIRSDIFSMLINSGFSVVVAPITMASNGQLLNTNADTIAQSVAVAMCGLYDVELVYIFEKRGVLTDVDDPQSLVRKITPDVYASLKAEKKVFDGMLPKIDNAFSALNNGVKLVRITDSIIAGSGTLICNENE